MGKRFNGQKLSHGHVRKLHTKCPLCGTQMVRFLGVLRCTEMKAGKGKGSASRRVIKHGSLRTIAHRQEQASALTAAHSA